jgi:hypothetical protein
MIAINSIFGCTLARQRTRRKLLAGYAILMAAFAVLTALRDANLLPLPHRPLQPLGTAGGIGMAVSVFIFTRWVLGNLVDFDGKQLEAVRTPFQFLNGFIDGLCAFSKKTYLSPVDERDVISRNRACYDAFRFLRSIVLVVCIVEFFIPATFQPWLEAPFAFLAVLALMHLPQAIILWSEPDMEEPR